MKLAAEDMKRTTMELGGHGPVLVFDDVEVDRVLDVPMVAGQIPQLRARSASARPASSSQEDVFDEVRRDGSSSAPQGVKVGDGLDPATQMGPMANPRRPDAMERLIGDAIAARRHARCGGSRIGNQGFFFAPTVLSNVPLDAADHERGAVRSRRHPQPVRGEADMIEEANRLPYGLAAYAWTADSPSARSASHARSNRAWSASTPT
jgi:succinate-semialdehyde dehydrogenase/glutarate-semialdehyde dehydrogenase